MKFGSTTYSADGLYAELVDANGEARPHASRLVEYFSDMEPGELADRQHAVDSTIVDMGISFTIYSEGDNIDRAWPLEIKPRYGVWAYVYGCTAVGRVAGRCRPGSLFRGDRGA